MFFIVQSDQKVLLYLMIIMQKVTSNVQSDPRQSLERGTNTNGICYPQF
jgi:hypothetical protein